MKTADINREQINSDLFAFANHWTDEVMNRIVEQADEIWENDAVVFMLHKHAEAKANYEERRADEFKSKLNGKEPIELAKYYKEESGHYHAVLTNLLCGFGE